MFKKLLAVSALSLACVAAQAVPVTLVDGSTQGLYNQGIGNLLDGTSSAFPTATDPTLNFAVAPDLSAAAVPLGNWLTAPSAPGGSWSGPQAIPATWQVTTETAIIYSFDAGPGGMNVDARFGIDNGIFVWLDGVFMGGHLRPGGPVLGEFQFQSLVSAGLHHLQVLREDHGGLTGYSVLVTGTGVVPEPASLSLIAIALLAAGATSRRRA